ncbi:GNAT family N-acetyltransferase [Micromonospora sediminicola]|uniref:GNAT family N-acetyltransferase n=1 Tax=Micromonospora sediminicola TaxID=946078 RepID=UPI0037BA9CB9
MTDRGRGDTDPSIRLTPYHPSAAEHIATWARASHYSRGWLAPDTHEAQALIARWHADPDVCPYLLNRGDRPVGYGELWVERDDDEAELAHILVAPQQRRRGLGRRLARELVRAARERGLHHITLRVMPDNTPAIDCYRSAGFVREGADDERVLNTGQPHIYQWMRYRDR